MANVYHFLILCGINSIVIVSGNEVCEDEDKSLCTLMLSRIPHACSDNCLSKLCKRSCGLCPLMCYECMDIADASTCKTLTTCRKDQYCFTAQTFTINFSEAYRLGCGPIETCMQYSSIVHNNINNRVNLEAGCCNQDKCNNKPPPLMHIRLPSNNTNRTIPTSDPSFCVNLDDDFCTRLIKLHPDACSDDCIASKICPHMCQKCFYCYDCKEVAHPKDCIETTACGYDKECFALEKLGSNFLPAVQLGCMNKKVCDMFENPSGHTIGRKRSFNLAGGCCIGDWCNAHIGEVQTTSKSVTASTTNTSVTVGTHCNYQYNHQCPQGFKPIGKNCYLLGNISMSKTDAKNFCQQHCAHLVKFSDKSDILNVFSHYNNIHKDIKVYTSLKKNFDSHWIWESDNSHANQQLLENNFRLTSDTCAIAYITYRTENGHTVYTYGLSPVNCSDTTKPLCYVMRRH